MKAFAKVNLFLDVLQTDEKSMHILKTIFYKVEQLFDVVTIAPCEKEFNIKMVNSDGKEIQIELENNLIYKAWKLFNQNSPQKIINIEFVVEKNIPIAGGMAGGSTDCAASLLLLNSELKNRTGEELNFEILLQMSKELGADVAFCLIANSQNGVVACVGEHYGEELISIPTELDLNFEFKFLSCGNSTPEIFKLYDSMPKNQENFTNKYTAIFDGLINNNKEMVINNIYNALTEPALISNKNIDVNEINRGWHVSGSGPTLFTIF